ncbi:N-acetyl-alpha-D-glucosaminyl L-malate synthase BshA [Salisediminibacterium beveridgei]|uniref:Glycosyl transferase, group 1 family protein n=1 Tax=Salisediminibacterium beveridgei TaxID=632773 RepID=A0A1D7QV04_9BACI|nr:N-acetyl-alpha-D-glucosaminyl L-malate synthase BshA [Salisediminibacterium beveridgei]AOM82831.1 Glycosyl transferase, group 1 family protein [Salisediminibacterium beveridgei]
MTLKIGITCYPTVGGSGVVATELGKALAIKGHEIHFISSSMPFRLGDDSANTFFHEVEVNQYSVFRFPPYDLALANKMAEVIVREELDILHVHYAIPHAISAYLAKQMVNRDVKVITTLHGTDITVLGYDPSLSDMIRFGIEQSDAVTAVSDDLVSQTRELLSITCPIETVYNFVDHEIYYPRYEKEMEEKIGLTGKELVISHVSNFRKVKRVDDVVRTFALIQAECDAVLMLIGEGPELPVIRKLVHELGIEEHVRFLGNQRKIAELLSLSHVSLLLSEKESFGLVILEAMACGVPVVGSNIGGIPEVIEEGVSGYICELGDLTSVRDAVFAITKDPLKHASMRQAAIQRAGTVFHKDRIVAHYEDVYYRTLAEGAN